MCKACPSTAITIGRMRIWSRAGGVYDRGQERGQMNKGTFKKTLDRWVCIRTGQVIGSERIRHPSILIHEFDKSRSIGYQRDLTPRRQRIAAGQRCGYPYLSWYTQPRQLSLKSAIKALTAKPTYEPSFGRLYGHL